MTRKNQYLDFSNQLSQSRISELKQIYLEKQLKIESLERDREATLHLLTEAQKLQNSEKMTKAKPGENQLKKERKFLSNPPREPKFFAPSRAYNDLQKYDDFKEYIDREYLQLKLDLENLRTQTKKEQEDPNNTDSLLGLSEISKKNHDMPSIFQSFSVNPLKSPGGQKEENFFKPSFKFKENKKEEKEGVKKGKNLTIVSNNIEIKPVKRKKSDLRLEVQARDEINNPAKRTSHSASNKKINKEQTKTDEQFLPYTVPYYMCPYPYTDYARMSYYPCINGSENQAVYKPFLFKDISETEKNEISFNYQDKSFEDPYPDPFRESKPDPPFNTQVFDNQTRSSEKALKTEKNQGKEEIVTFGDQSESQTSEESEKKPVLINIGDTGNKPLSQIFNERKGKIVKNIQDREEHIQRYSHASKTKNELRDIRKNQLKTPTLDLKAASRSPKKQDKSSELTERLLSGQRVKLSKEEIQKINRRLYGLLPEVRQKQQEELKKQEKQDRIQKLRDYEQVIYS